MLFIRDCILDSVSKYKFPKPAVAQQKKIFSGHAKTWLGADNIALSVFSDQNLFTTASLKTVKAFLTDAQRESMLWSKKYKLSSFFTSDAGTAPCLADDAPGAEFWGATMNSNRSCERYIREN